MFSAHATERNLGIERVSWSARRGNAIFGVIPEHLKNAQKDLCELKGTLVRRSAQERARGRLVRRRRRVIWGGDDEFRPQKFAKYTVEQNVDVPGTQVHEDIVEVFQLAPQEHLSEHTVEQIVDVLGRHTAELTAVRSGRAAISEDMAQGQGLRFHHTR